MLINLKRVNFIFNKSFISSYFIEQIYIYEEENIISISKHTEFLCNKTHLIVYFRRLTADLSFRRLILSISHKFTKSNFNNWNLQIYKCLERNFEWKYGYTRGDAKESFV